MFRPVAEGFAVVVPALTSSPPRAQAASSPMPLVPVRRAVIIGDEARIRAHDDLATHADLQSRRPRLRAGRGRLAAHGGWATIPRLRRGHRDELARPQSPSARRRGPGAGGAGDAREQPLPRAAGGEAGRALRRGHVRGQRVLLQLRCRGERGSRQGHAPGDARGGQAGALPRDLLRGRLPRADARDARGHREPEIP